MLTLNPLKPLSQIQTRTLLAGNTQECWTVFKEKLKELVNKHVPLKSLSSKARKAIWMTHRSRKLVAKKRMVFAKHKDRHHPAVVTANKKASKALRQAKRNFEVKLAKNIKKDAKSFFAYARSKGKSKFTPCPVNNIATGNKIESLSDIAEEFNNYFVSVFNIEDNHVPQAGDSVSGKTLNRLSDFQFSEEDIRKKLMKIREDKAPGADDIAPRLLCHIVHEITKPLWIIFRKSLDEGLVPEDWKRANVSPVFKAGCRSSVENYRPISLTSQVCKVFESLLRDKIVNYLESYQILLDSQHGFRKGRSCMTNLLTLLETVTKCLDDGENIDIVFLDFA